MTALVPVAFSGLVVALLTLLAACGAQGQAAQPYPTYAQIASGAAKAPKPGARPVQPYYGGASYYEPSPSNAPAPLASPAQVAQAATRFSLDVAKGVLRSSEGNAVVSPLGVAHMLSLLQQAADPLGPAAAQLEAGLHLDKESSRRGVPSLLQNAITKSKAKSVLENGNNMFLSTEWKLKDGFQRTAQADYHMNVTSVDFKQPDAAVAAINSWASDATHGRIPALVNKRSLSPRTSLVLASAMYFRGVWLRKFDVGKSKQDVFSVNASRNVTTFLMQQVADFRLGELSDLKAQWLELPFDGDHFSMLLVLPYERNGLNAVLQGLDSRHILDMLADTPARRAIVSIPRFHIGTNADLTPVLKHLGMSALFGRDAKLRGASDNPLSVSDVLHKAEMKVDEEGATASAASAVLVNTLSLLPFSDDMKFKADHPFLAIIVDRTSKVPLFVGRVTEPITDF
ncbi:leukocyte elastase inhibitor [Frankliniella occidentalis]|uniref:Leukocyte elastase inhibitor n=1 Tax=Frankliniella occidentalis TaxID=133901 RepID=A0A6J1SLK3_FRAOC|nr:leukocyte elastase inhibitor [Frankliniella occidentalis]